MRPWLVVLIFELCTLASAAQAVSAGCQRLALRLDPALTPDVVDDDWASGQAHVKAPAVLELRGCEGQLLDRLALEAPLAKLDPVPLRGAPSPTYLVSVDLTAPAGSYNGPLTFPVSISKNRLQRVATTTRNQGRREPITLPLTGKAAWKKVAVGTADDLLSVRCEPHGPAFRVVYRRYHPSRHGWTVRQHAEPGFWESDDEFPDVQRF